MMASSDVGLLLLSTEMSTFDGGAGGEEGGGEGGGGEGGGGAGGGEGGSGQSGVMTSEYPAKRKLRPVEQHVSI